MNSAELTLADHEELKERRNFLERLTCSGPGSLREQIAAINAAGFPTIAEPLSWRDRLWHDEVNINCHAYAFGLGDDDEFRDCAYRDAGPTSQGRFANSGYVRFLIQKLIITPVTEPRRGDHIVYFDANGKPAHSGILAEESKIHSKWGSIAIFVHDIWDVPVSYGAKAIYYSQIENQAALNGFFQYISAILIK